MGVPAFFRWLSKKYSSIIVHCVEQKRKEVGGVKIPIDASQPNPNDVEFDNLYLDMNGIIHPCCHPEDKAAPENEQEMMLAIFEYIDRIFSIVRPRRLLYMAIDGVAPRAKMNQQRSRRFRAAKESMDKREDMKRIRSELLAKGCQLPPEKPSTSHFDSNCITPGTEFMANLATALRYYVYDKMNTDPAWQGIKVILSDANVPGEGEHKIMDYIRHQRASEGHDPNTHHCLYGADADLIMLGLATHEPNFTIIREEFKQSKPKPCEICNQEGHTMNDCTGAVREKRGEFDEFAVPLSAEEKEFIFVRLNVLREYLERELRIDGLPFPFDFERAIDDWVFMCFFVGNDFLPHLPSLQIREGAIDRLIRLYKEVVPQSHGYLTHNGEVNLPRVQLMLNRLGEVEDGIFKKRREDELQFRQRQKAKRQRMDNSYSSPKWVPQGQFAPQPIGSTPSPVQNARHEAYHMRQQSLNETDTAVNASNKNAAQDLRSLLKKDKSCNTSLTAQSPAQSPASGNNEKSRKRTHNEMEEEDEDINDDVRLWEDGFKQRYYSNKFGVDSTDRDFVSRVSNAYARGLCWVLRYYYQGCSSWNWYYPFHYAPFASDFCEIGKLRNDFREKTVPFHPLEQLMAVFPAASGNFLPESWRNLMADPESPIIDFYPENFRIDLNGKKYAWQGVALLPFVDEKRLLKALEAVYPDLTTDEECRNSRGCGELFVHESHDVSSMLYGLYEDHPDTASDHQSIPLNPSLTNGMSGIIKLDDKMQQHLNAGFIEPPFPPLRVIKDNRVVSCQYEDPFFPSTFVFEATLLPGAEIPTRTLKPENYGSGQYFPVLGFKPRERQHPYSTPPSAKRTIQHSLSDPGHHYNQQPRNPSMRGGYNNPRNHYQQGYNDGYGSPYQRQASSQMQWESIPPPLSQPPWSAGRQQRHQQDDHQYHHYNSYPSTPQRQGPQQHQPYKQQQQYQPYQQQQWKGQHNRTPSWSRHQ